jgi:hypothetical protein
MQKLVVNNYALGILVLKVTTSPQVVTIKHNHKSPMNIGEMVLLRNDSNEQVSPIYEDSTEIQNIYTLQGNNLTTQRTHGLSDLTYGYLLLSRSEVEIAPVHLGPYVWPCRHPRLPHSPSNNHHRVPVMVQSSSYRSY